MKMTSKVIIDTHAFIWFIEGIGLSPEHTLSIGDYAQDNRLCLSAISLCEISMLAKKERISFHIPCLQWIEKALELPGLEVIPLSPAIAVEGAFLPGTFHGDPADRLIVATARVLQSPLITRDKRIIQYAKEGYLEVIEV
jgi:PIN domain nuclease of toxin-antitoxin system